MTNKLESLIRLKRTVHALLIISLVLMAGCDQDETHMIESDQKPIAVDGDVLLFRSGNDVDSIAVFVVHYIRSSDKRYYYEHYYIRHQLIEGGKKSIGAFCAIHQEFNGPRIFLNSVPEYVGDTTLTIKGKNLRVGKYKTSWPDPVEPDVLFVYYHAREGLVRYQLKSGSKYERME